MEVDWFTKLHKPQYNTQVYDPFILIAIKCTDGRYGFVFKRQQGISFCHLFQVIPGEPSVLECYLRGMVQLQLNLNIVFTVSEEFIENQILVLHADCFESGMVFYLNGADDIFYIKSILREQEVIWHITN